MGRDETDAAIAGASAPRGDPSLPTLERLRATGRRQARLIDALSEAVSNLTVGAQALRAENFQLRAELSRLRGRLRLVPEDDAHLSGEQLAEVEIPLGCQAPALAREVVERCLVDRVAPSELDNARLVVSELVTNSVRHSGAGEGDDVVVRVRLWRDVCRLEVEDPGSDGQIGPQRRGAANGGGMGLNLVQLLSQRWGVVRANEGPTRVWAQLSCSPAADARRAANGGTPPPAHTA